MNLHVGGVIKRMATGTSIIEMQYEEPSFVLYIGHPGITNEEVYEIQHGDVQMALSIINGEALFFLFATGKMPWADAPFEPNLAGPQERMEPFEDGTGVPVVIVAVDTNNGMVKAMRIISLTTKMSNRLVAFYNRRRSEPFDRMRYHKLVNAIYNAYSSSEQMLSTVNPEMLIIIAGA